MSTREDIREQDKMRIMDGRVHVPIKDVNDVIHPVHQSVHQLHVENAPHLKTYKDYLLIRKRRNERL